MKQMVTIGLFLISSGILTSANGPAKPTDEYSIDILRSKIEFFVASSAGDVNGTFKSWKGTFGVATPGVPESATLKLEISAPSLTTGSRIKDKMVKGKDFFYVHSYPTIDFVSTKVIPSGDPDNFRAQGNFTLRGVTKPVTLRVDLDPNRNGGGRIYANLSFDRRNFGMTKNVPFIRVSDSVRVRLELFIVAKPAAAGPSP
ncbi:MAG: YceI family protein [Candidatus Acidiferrales bacterium]